MKYTRLLNLKKLLENRSYFLFGPRATGKSTLIRQSLPDAQVYDLLEAETFQRLVRRPALLGEQAVANKPIVIDEIQKLPSLLDEVHRLIESKGLRFLLTGSSARKLKKGGVNLLAGRAFTANFFPLVSQEIPAFDLLTYLNSTGLPEFYGSQESTDFLEAYVGTYLQLEIQAESLTRDLQGFVRFLDVVALCNGQEINFTAIGSDTGVPERTVANYFSILEDTLLGFKVEPFRQTKKRRALSHAKFYWFDIGVVNWLTQRENLQKKSELFGDALEHFIAIELRAYLSYRKRRVSLQYWRSKAKFEVDFVLGNTLAIEVKGTDLVRDKHLKGLRALKEEGLIERFFIVSLDPEPRKTEDGIGIVPVSLFLDQLWADALRI